MLLRKHKVEVVPWEELLRSESIADEVALMLPRAQTELGVLAIAAQHPGGLNEWVVQTTRWLEEKPDMPPPQKEFHEERVKIQETVKVEEGAESPEVDT